MNFDDLRNTVNGESEEESDEQQRAPGDLGDMLGGLLGGSQGGGNIGDLLGALGGAQEAAEEPSQQAGDLSGLLGGLLGGSQQDGGMGDLLGALTGSAPAQEEAQPQAAGDLAGMLGGLLGGQAAGGGGGGAGGAGGLGGLLGGLLGGADMGGLLNVALGAFGGQLGLDSDVLDGIAERIGISPEILQMAVTFLISKIATGNRGGEPVLAALGQKADPSGLDISDLVQHLDGQGRPEVEYLESTGLVGEFAEQAGIDRAQATSSLQEVFGALAAKARDNQQSQDGSDPLDGVTSLLGGLG